jgi:hypothetical protein
MRSFARKKMCGGLTGEQIEEHYSGGNHSDRDVVQNRGGGRYRETLQSKIRRIRNVPAITAAACMTAGVIQYGSNLFAISFPFRWINWG